MFAVFFGLHRTYSDQLLIFSTAFIHRNHWFSKMSIAKLKRTCEAIRNIPSHQFQPFILRQQNVQRNHWSHKATHTKRNCTINSLMNNVTESCQKRWYQFPPKGIPATSDTCYTSSAKLCESISSINQSIKCPEWQIFRSQSETQRNLTHLCRVDSPTLTLWTSSFPI